MIVKYLFITLFTLGVASSSTSIETYIQKPNATYKNSIYDANYPWVDSIMSKMTLDEKIGQLFMVAAYSNKDAAHEKEVETLIKKYKIGGLIFMQGGPVRQVKLTNNYQSISKIPLLIAMDAEWGAAMRLDSIMAFQRQLTWGAIQDDSIIYAAGKMVAQQLKRLGVNINFAPDIDINNNPNNPVIGDRSFGEDKLNVALKGVAYMNGMQENGVLACGKHFPGHGDVTADSHKTLPIITKSFAQLDSLELFPFKILINEGLASIMLAHLYVPALDSTLNQATSLSAKVGKTLLRDSLHFKGLVFSDALNMKGVSGYNKPGQLEIKAFLAGNDFLLMSENVPLAFDALKQAIADSSISLTQLNESVERILKAKAFCGLNKYKPSKVQNLQFDLNTYEAELLKRKITEKSLTLANAADSLLPFKKLDTLTIASVSIGDGNKTNFQTYLSKYTNVKQLQISTLAESSAFTNCITKLASNDVVIVSLHEISKSADKKFGINQNEIEFIKNLSSKTKVIVVVFGTPYALGNLDAAQYQIVCYDNGNYTQQAAAMALFGAIPFEGTLPVGSGKFHVNDGVSTSYLQRLKYTIPQEVGMDEEYLTQKIDSIAKVCIDNEAAPGCVVLVAKDGKVVFDKAYGYFTYDKLTKVTTESIYDLASVTKVCATTLALMSMQDAGKFNVDNKVVDYLPDTKGSQIEQIEITDLLTHQAGLVSWVPFYKNTLNADESLNPQYYNQTAIKGFNIKVADGIFLRNDYQDTIWQIIKDTPLKTKKKYVYSDLTMYISRRMFETISGESIKPFMSTTFYDKLGMQTTCYNPLEKFEKSDIVPTEKDNYYRYQLVQGYVHDMGAAMMGGVEGHAGLFSNAEDIAILFQMLLNSGEYGGEHFLNATTIKQWTSRYSSISRRGFGFDKADKEGNSPCSDYASALTFGHQGFTGICVWADPKYNLLYIFLSNRVNPKADPNKLNSLGIRNSIMDAIYASFLKTSKKESAMN